jgi:hypothetical protein
VLVVIMLVVEQVLLTLELQAQVVLAVEVTAV